MESSPAILLFHVEFFSYIISSSFTRVYIEIVDRKLFLYSMHVYLRVYIDLEKDSTQEIKEKDRRLKYAPKVENGVGYIYAFYI